MGLLDDLRQQASEKEEIEAQENNLKANTEEIYRNQTIPSLKEMYSHLAELAKHLNYLDKDIRSNYVINAEGLEVEFLQREYNVHIDSTKDTKLVTLSFKCGNPKMVEFSINDPKKVPGNAQFLKQSQLQHQVVERKNDKLQLTGAQFTVKPLTMVKFNFEADIDNGAIKFKCSNFDQFGTITRSLKPEDVNEEFMDQLDRYIIRENENFLKEDVADDVREQIRMKIEQEKLERQEELKAAEKLREEEEARKAEEGKFGFFKKLKTS